MNTTTVLIWYYKESQDTIHEIQVFNTEEEARNFLKTADHEDYIVRLIRNVSVFVQNEHGNLLKH